MLCSMALPSKLCAVLHSQSNVGSGSEGKAVSTQGQKYISNRKNVMLTKGVLWGCERQIFN